MILKKENGLTRINMKIPSCFGCFKIYHRKFWVYNLYLKAESRRTPPQKRLGFFK